MKPYSFRPLRRKNQQLSPEECRQVLSKYTLGVLSVNGDHGYPYGTPINYWFDEETDTLYFHSGLKGHRNEAMERDQKVSFCVVSQGVKRADHWSKDYQSVIVFGRVFPVSDEREKLRIVRKLSEQFTQDASYIDKEIRTSFPVTYIFGCHIEHLCGKCVNES